MPEEPPRIVAGFPEMWQPVYDRYGLFFKAAGKIQDLVKEMASRVPSGELSGIVCRMVCVAANTLSAIVTLVLNGYGYDAMKLGRSVYEAELNIFWLKNHPGDIKDFIDYNVIQQKQEYDALPVEQKQTFPKERYEQMMADYNAMLPRFTTKHDSARPRNEWCRVSIYERAKEAEQYWQTQIEEELVSHYKAFYRPASSMHHGDIGGLLAQMDSNGNVGVAPSWECLDDALVSGLGSFIRCVVYFDEIAQLGFKERLENGTGKDYVSAVESLMGGHI